MIDFSVPIEQLQEAIDAFKRAIDAFKRAIVEAARALCKILPIIVDFILETYAKLISLGKWWHLYKHAKRRRTRKKYYNKIRKLVSASFA